MIQLKNIEKCYETRAGKNYVLRQITLNIGEGEFVTRLGPSAAGKTTLLNILGMLDGDWEGEYYLFEHVATGEHHGFMLTGSGEGYKSNGLEASGAARSMWPRGRPGVEFRADAADGESACRCLAHRSGCLCRWTVDPDSGWAAGRLRPRPPGGKDRSDGGVEV
ncbi:MAG: hypothetical protein A2Y77_07735 [Planctomycetes bacterium RBG_13_62_9]|nr:MAG: hypothetical protein A2Y77_07735 [Planctomycetes bacterium RBG_13_62_9]